jgi:phosphate acyltransferase
VTPVRVAVDAMGSDRGPAAVVAGAQAAAAGGGIEPVVVGPANLDTGGLELIEAPDVIEMDEKPTDAVRTKPASSLVVACRVVREGRADAVVSPGNTGAMLAASLLHIGRLKGVLRPAIAVVVPAASGPHGPSTSSSSRRWACC